MSIDEGSKFAEGGDSGSLVFNLENEWAGMPFEADRSSGIGFVTSAYELSRDIEETTGVTIELVGV